jgi:3-oxoacyl-(acyl-carrier-protein) synthase
VYRLKGALAGGIHGLACALAQALPEAKGRVAVVVGSARGATELNERFTLTAYNHQSLPAEASPLTTSGSLSTHIAQYRTSPKAPLDFATDLSATCTGGAQAIVLAQALLAAGSCEEVVCGGIELPCTPYTFAQVAALRMYTAWRGPTPDAPTPVQPFNARRANTFALGEGGALFVVRQSARPDLPILGVVRALGTAREHPPTHTGISADGQALQQAMHQALKQVPEPPQVVVAHAPGTRKGDQAEWTAIQAVWQAHGWSEPPYVFSTKHLTGHTYGASFPLSLACVLRMFAIGSVPVVRYSTYLPAVPVPGTINSILINAAGFGGQAVSAFMTPG